MRNILLSLFPVLLVPGLWAAEYPLLQDGKAVSQIIVAEDAPLPVQYAARELARYLAKISAGETPSIAPVKTDNLYPVFLGTAQDQTLTVAAGVQVSGLKEGGFAIRAGRDGLYIIGGDPVGALYGAYEILKKYGGIRWIFPGEEGEYFQPRTTIAVAEQNIRRTPYLEYRQMELTTNAGGTRSPIPIARSTGNSSNCISIGRNGASKPITATKSPRTARSAVIFCPRNASCTRISRIIPDSA